MLCTNVPEVSEGCVAGGDTLRRKTVKFLCFYSCSSQMSKHSYKGYVSRLSCRSRDNILLLNNNAISFALCLIVTSKIDYQLSQLSTATFQFA